MSRYTILTCFLLAACAAEMDCPDAWERDGERCVYVGEDDDDDDREDDDREHPQSNPEGDAPEEEEEEPSGSGGNGGGGGSSEPDCTPRAATTCWDGAVYYEDSCGNREEMKQDCAYACADDGSQATCIEFEILCDDAATDCEHDGTLEIDFECEIRNLGDEPIEISDLELLPSTADDPAIESFLDDYWAGPASFPANTWVMLDDWFHVELDDTLLDEELDMTVSARVTIWGVTVLLDDIPATLDVYDFWVDDCQAQAN